MKRHSLFALLLTLSASAAAQQVYVSGLEFPSKVITIPNGYLMVTETGTRPNTGRVTLVAPGGVSRNLIAGLPSGLSYPTALKYRRKIASVTVKLGIAAPPVSADKVDGAL